MLNSNEIEFEALHASKKWKDILDIYECEKIFERAASYFYVAEACFQLGEQTRGLEIVKKGLILSPKNTWGITIKCNIMATSSEQDAIDELHEFIINQNYEVPDHLLSRVIEYYRKTGKLDIASSLNLRRRHFKLDSEKRYAIAIQTFNKPDTLNLLLKSLLLCESPENFSVVIIQDSWVGSNKEELFRQGYNEVKNVIYDNYLALVDKFSHLDLIVNRENLGTAPSCIKLLNYVCKNYDGFVFFEDDCVLSHDALQFTEYQLSNTINRFGPYFATCESVCFDYGRGKEPSGKMLEDLNLLAAENIAFYAQLDFVPSTNFATLSEIWQDFWKLRCFPRGPETLNQHYITIAGKTVYPIVPRVADIGMEHQYGYSTTKLGAGNVKEIKNTYVTSDDFSTTKNILPYKGDDKLLYLATSRMHLDTMRLLLQKHIN